jgi:hypothetical protein
MVERYYLARSFASFFAILAAATMAHAWTAPGMDELFYVGLGSMIVAALVFVRAHRLLRAIVLEETAQEAALEERSDRARDRLERVERAMREEPAGTQVPAFSQER